MKINLLKNIIITLGFLSMHALFAGSSALIQEQNNLIVPTSQEILNDRLENGDQLEDDLEDDFNCFLMMDPGTLENLEKGAQALGIEPGMTVAQARKAAQERDKAQAEKAKIQAQPPVVIRRNVVPSQNQVTVTHKLPEVTTVVIPTSAMSSTSAPTKQLTSVVSSSPEIKKSHETGVLQHKVSPVVGDEKPLVRTLADQSEKKLLHDEEESEGTLGFLKEEIRHNILSIIFAELATQTGHEAEASEKVAKEISLLKKKLGYQPEWDSATLEDTLVVKCKIEEIALSRAQESGSEADWMNAYDEAHELNALLQQIIHKTNEKIALAVQQEDKEKYNKEYQEFQRQKQQWLEKATLAQTKGNCAKLRDCWERFFQTVEDYEKNPDLSNARSIIEGAGEISSITHEIASMIKKASREVGDTMSYANNALRSLIDAKTEVRINQQAYDSALLAKNCAERADSLWTEEAQTMVHIGQRIINSAEVIRGAAQSLGGKIRTTQNSSNERKLLTRDKGKFLVRQRAVKQKEVKLKTLETLLEQEKKILESNYQKKEEKVALEYSQRLQKLEEQEKSLTLQREELTKGLLQDNASIQAKRKALEVQEKELQEKQKALEATKNTYFVEEKSLIEKQSSEFKILSEKLKGDIDKLNSQENFLNKEKEWLKAREASLEARESELSEIFKQKAAQAEEKARVVYEAALQQMTTETKGMVNEAQQQIREAEAAKREAEQIAQEALQKMKADQEKNKNLVDQAQEETERLREALRALEEKNRIAERDKIEAEKRVLEIQNATEAQMAQLKAKAHEAETNQVKAELGKAAIEITMILEKPKVIAMIADEAYKKALVAPLHETVLLWDQAIIKAQEAEASYKQAEQILFSRAGDSTITGEVKAQWNQNLEEVQKVHASWVNQVVEWNQEKVKNETIKNEICQFIQNAEQEEILANDALRQAKEISLNVSQETREAAWNDALESSKKAAQAWEKVVACFKAHEKSNIMQGNTYWVVLMNQAENQVIRWNAKSLWREANQLEVKVLESTLQAERFRKGTEENIKAWGEVLEPAKQLVEIMKEVESIYTKNIPKVLKELKEFKKELIAEQNEAEGYYNKCVDNRKNILEKKRESNFFKDAGRPIIEDAKASLAHAQELEKQADATYQKAQRGVGEGINLVWDDALTQIEKAEKAYAQTVEIYENNINKIANASNASKIAWNKELEVAKAGKGTCAAKLETSKVEKIKKMKDLEKSLLKAEQEQIANLHVEITRLLKEPTRKAVIAQEAYEKATKVLGAVPLWEEAITKAQETAEIYSQTEQMLLRGSQQAPSAQLQALWNQSLEIIKNDYASWTNKAVTWTQEKDQSIELKKIEERKATKKKAAQDQIIKWKKQAEDALQKSTRAQTAGKTDESEGWSNVHLSLLNAIEQKEKAIEAEVNEQSTIAQILKEAVQQSIKASEYYTKAINAYIAGEKTNAEFFNNAASDAQSSADYLKLASEVIEKTLDFFPNSTSAANCFVAPVLEASSSSCHSNAQEPSTPCTSSAQASFKSSLLCFKNNISEDEASLYQKLAEQYQLAAQYKQESAEQLILHRRDGANAFNSSISDAESRIDCLKRTITIFEQAVNAQQMGHQSIAPLFHKLIQQHQLLDDLYQHLSDLCEQARKKKSTNDGRDSYYLAADFRFLDYTRECAGISNDQTILAAKTLDKVKEAEKNQNHRVSSLYQQQIEIYQSAAEYYRKAGELHSSRSETEANYFEEAGRSVKEGTKLIELIISAAEYAQEAEKNENRELGSLHQKQIEVYQNAIKYYEKAGELHSSRNTTAAKCFYNAGRLEEPSVEVLKLAIKTLKKAQEAEKNGNQEAGSLYRKQVEIYQNATDYYQKEAVATTIGNNTEVNCFQEARNFTQPGIDMLTAAIKPLEKAQEAGKNKNQEISSLYRKQVEVYQNAAEYYQKAAVADAAGNKIGTKHAEEAVKFAQSNIEVLKLAIETLQKAQEAGKNGNQEISSSYHKQVEVHHNAIEYYQKAAVTSIEGNETAANYFKEAVNFVKPSIEVLELTIKTLWKTQEVEKNKNQEVGSLYCKQVKVYQSAAEYYQKAGKLYAARNTTAANYFKEAGDFSKPTAEMLQLAIKALEKTQEAEKSGNKEVTSWYRKQVDLYQGAVEYYQRAAESTIEGNKTEANYLDKAGSFAKPTAEILELAAESIKKAQEAEKNGHQKVGSLYYKQVELYQSATEYYQKAVIATTTGNQTKAKHFEGAVNFTKSSVEMLTLAIKFLEKAQEAEKNENQKIGSLYYKQAEFCQSAAEYYQKAAVATTEGNEVKAKHFDKAGSLAIPTGEVLKLAIEALKKAQEAEKNEDQELGSLYRKQLEVHEDAIKYYQKAAVITTEGNERQAIYFEDAVNFTQPSMDALELAIKVLKQAQEVEKTGNQEVGSLYRKQLEVYQSEVKHYRKSGEIYTLEAKDIVNDKFFIKPNIKDVRFAIGLLAKIQEAEKSENQEDQENVSLYRKQVEKYQNLIECYGKYFEKTINFSKSIKILGLAIETLKKIQETEKNEDQEVHSLYRKQVEVYQNAAEYYQKAAVATIVENKILVTNKEAKNFEEIGHLYEKNTKLIEAVISTTKHAQEAEKKGDQEVHSLYQKQVEVYQSAAEYYQKAAVASSVASNKEARHFKKMGCFSEKNAELIEAVINASRYAHEAEKNENKELNFLYQKQIEIYQNTTEYYQTVVDSNASENKTESNYFEEPISYTIFSINVLNIAAKSLKKALQAEKNDSQEIVSLYHKQVDTYQNAVKYYQMAVAAIIEKNETEVASLINTGNFTKKSADLICALIEAIKCTQQVEENKNQKLFSLYQKQVECYQHTVEYYQKAAEASASENGVEAECFEKAGKFNEKSIQLIKLALSAVQNHRSTNMNVNEWYNKEAILYQNASEYYQKAAEQEISANKNARINFDEAQRSMELSINCLNEISNNLKKSAFLQKGYYGFYQPWDGYGWDVFEELAKTCEQTITAYQSSAQAYEAGDGKTGAHLRDNARSSEGEVEMRMKSFLNLQG